MGVCDGRLGARGRVESRDGGDEGRGDERGAAGRERIETHRDDSAAVASVAATRRHQIVHRHQPVASDRRASGTALLRHKGDLKRSAQALWGGRVEGSSGSRT